MLSAILLFTVILCGVGPHAQAESSLDAATSLSTTAVVDHHPDPAPGSHDHGSCEDTAQSGADHRGLVSPLRSPDEQPLLIKLPAIEKSALGATRLVFDAGFDLLPPFGVHLLNLLCMTRV
ncbi:hypothetical protein GT755_22840 [Herbidospora sp. NEAU-GS84]|uniref:Uncharacterized protein n=1 Tax=Herbidospora solisilvae TaxID=2696284 RepID=A0A7C9N4T2_9ACTN|nr:hypothetical protein [Herbidospora solisilvae]NAS24514.1 hypothetical protein [Herbidospora solisilvae]